MTKKEAIKRIKVHIMAHRFNEPNAIRISEALEVAIRSLEAWRKLDDEVYGCICQYEGLNAYKTDAWHDGRVEGMKMIQHIINRHMKEVEE